MFHPVGPQPPSVYWRRRLAVFGSAALLIVLLAITIRTVVSDGGKSAEANGRTTPAVTTPVASTHQPSSSRPASSTPHTSRSTSASPSTPTPQPCDTDTLKVEAVVAEPTYDVGDQPVLELQVTNTGPQPCVQDLADKQVELKVYNGESRVWGSHDCQIQPGTNERTLAVDTAVRVAITWSGLSSQPDCAGTRQRVGAGTYTLYAALSGHTGKAAQFTLS